MSALYVFGSLFVRIKRALVAVAAASEPYHYKVDTAVFYLFPVDIAVVVGYVNALKRGGLAVFAVILKVLIRAEAAAVELVELYALELGYPDVSEQAVLDMHLAAGSLDGSVGSRLFGGERFGRGYFAALRGGASVFACGAARQDRGNDQ